MTFDEWWKEVKPAECDELKPWFIECWTVATEQAINHSQKAGE